MLVRCNTSFGTVYLIINRLRPYAFTAISKAGQFDDHDSYSAETMSTEETALPKRSTLHTDASSFTLNFCLGKPGFKGNTLRFVSDSDTITYDHQPLHGLLHRGNHKHEVRM